MRIHGKYIEYLKVNADRLLITEVHPVPLRHSALYEKTDKWMTIEHWKDLQILLNDLVADYERVCSQVQNIQVLTKDPIKNKTGTLVKIAYKWNEDKRCCSHFISSSYASSSEDESDDDINVMKYLHKRTFDGHESNQQCSLKLHVAVSLLIGNEDTEATVKRDLIADEVEPLKHSDNSSDLKKRVTLKRKLGVVGVDSEENEVKSQMNSLLEDFKIVKKKKIEASVAAPEPKRKCSTRQKRQADYREFDSLSSQNMFNNPSAELSDDKAENESLHEYFTGSVDSYHDNNSARLKSRTIVSSESNDKKSIRIKTSYGIPSSNHNDFENENIFDCQYYSEPSKDMEDDYLASEYSKADGPSALYSTQWESQIHFSSPIESTSKYEHENYSEIQSPQNNSRSNSKSPLLFDYACPNTYDSCCTSLPNDQNIHDDSSKSNSPVQPMYASDNFESENNCRTSPNLNSCQIADDTASDFKNYSQLSDGNLPNIDEDYDDLDELSNASSSEELNLVSLNTIPTRSKSRSHSQEPKENNNTLDIPNTTNKLKASPEKSPFKSTSYAQPKSPVIGSSARKCKMLDTSKYFPATTNPTDNIPNYYLPNKTSKPRKNLLVNDDQKNVTSENSQRISPPQINSENISRKMDKKLSSEEDSIADSVKRRRQSPDKYNKVTKRSPAKFKDKIYWKNIQLFGSDEDSDDGAEPKISSLDQEMCPSSSAVVTSSDSPDIRYSSSTVRDRIGTRKNKLLEENTSVESSSDKITVHETVKKTNLPKLKSESKSEKVRKSRKTAKDSVPSNQVKITDSISSGNYEFNSARSNVKKMEARVDGMMSEQTIMSDDELPDLNCDIKSDISFRGRLCSDISKSNSTNSLENRSIEISQEYVKKSKISKKINSNQNDVKKNETDNVQTSLGSKTKVDDSNKVSNKMGRKSKVTVDDKQSSINTWLTKAKPKETKAKPKETKAKPKETKAKQKETKAKQKETKAKQKETKTKPKETKASQKETKANQKETKANQKESKAKQKESKAKQKESKAKPKDAKPNLADDDDFTPLSKKMTSKSKAPAKSSKSKLSKKKSASNSPEKEDLESPEKDSMEQFDEQNDSQDYNYSIDSWGNKVTRIRPFVDDTILISDSMNIEEEKPDPMWEFILKQQEIEANLPSYLKKEYVCETMQKLRDDYDVKETIVEFLKSKQDWLREVLAGKEECVWDKTYKKSARAGESLNYCQYYGVLSSNQITTITRYLEQIFEEELKRIFLKDSRPYHRYIWQVQVPLVATLLCEQVTNLNWDKSTEVILRARNVGATVSSFNMEDFLKSD